MSRTASKPATDQRSQLTADSQLTAAIRDHIDAYVDRHGHKRAAEDFGVSRHTLWRFLRRGHLGRSLPKAVLSAVGETVNALEGATQKLIEGSPSRQFDGTSLYLTEELVDTLRLICATPLATAKELASLGLIPTSTLKVRLRKLTQRGLVNFVSHRLAALGPRLTPRYYPTKRGIVVGGDIEHGTDTFLREYPVSKRWFQLLAERLDAVAVLYHTAAMVADADPRKKPLRVDFYRQGPYDMLITLSERQAIGIIRQGPMLPTANLRYRLRSMRFLRDDMKPTITLVLTHSDQATRRVIRALGTRGFTTGSLWPLSLIFSQETMESLVWQRCGAEAYRQPVEIDPSISLVSIVTGMEDMLEASEFYQRATGYSPPNPDDLYPTFRRATMPEPSNQLNSSLAVQLTAAEKQGAGPAGLLAPVHQGTTGGSHGRSDPPPRQPGPTLPHQTLPGVGRGETPRRDGRRPEIPGPPRQGLCEHGPGPVERTPPRKQWQQRYHLPRDFPAHHRIPDGPPRRRHQLRREGHRRGSPLRRLRSLRPAAHIPFHHRLQIQRHQLRCSPRRRLCAGTLGIRQTLPAGVRAKGHHPQTHPSQTDKLPTLLPQRLAAPGPRRIRPIGALRVRDLPIRECLPTHRRRNRLPATAHLQQRTHQRAWGVG